MVEPSVVPGREPGVAPSLYELLRVPVPSSLDRWVPGWAVPPVYGAGLARSVPSVVLSGCADRDAAAVRLGGWAVGYGRGVVSVGAPASAVAAAGMWQLAAHVAAAAVVAHVGDGDVGPDEAFIGLLTDLIQQLWPAWATVRAPGPGRLRAGLAARRHADVWCRDLPPDAGVDELVRCATTSGAQVGEAQHRLMHLMVQRPDRLRAVAAVLEFAA